MKHAEPKKKVTKQRKQIYIITSIITIILLAITSIVGVKIAKNGLSLKGMLMTSIGQDEKDIQNLEPFYCLVMGVSEDIEAKLTDTIMLCAYYPNEQKVSMLSIPRDTFVGNNKTKADSYDKINALYQKSPEKTVEAVRNLTGINVRNYVVISNNALKDVVDAIDGVYFDVPINMNYDDYDQKLHIRLKKGYQLLNGDKAEQLVRFRHNNDKTTYPVEYGTEDIGRMRTQREFLKAAAKQILSGDNILKIDDIMKVVFENVETNLKMEDIIKYIPSAIEFNPENIKSEMLPGKPSFIAPLSFYVSDEEESNKVVSNLFGISEEEIKENKKKFEKESGKKITTTTKNNNSKNKTTTTTKDTKKKPTNTLNATSKPSKPSSSNTSNKPNESGSSNSNAGSTENGQNQKPETGGNTESKPNENTNSGSGGSQGNTGESGTGSNSENQNNNSNTVK